MLHYGYKCLFYFDISMCVCVYMCCPIYIHVYHSYSHLSSIFILFFILSYIYWREYSLFLLELCLEALANIAHQNSVQGVKICRVYWAAIWRMGWRGADGTWIGTEKSIRAVVIAKERKERLETQLRGGLGPTPWLLDVRGGQGWPGVPAPWGWPHIGAFHWGDKHQWRSKVLGKENEFEKF